MARAIKRPNLSRPKLPSLPRLPDPSEPDVFEEMTLLEHMEELRDRIVKVSISIGIAFIAGFILAGPLLRRMAQQANIQEDGFDIGGPTDTITIYMKVALYIAVGFAMPIIIYHFFGFLAPGLTRKEKRILYMSLPFVALLFLGGAAYAFFGAAPPAFRFLSTWQNEIFSWDPDGNEIISFYLTLMIGLGLAFQMPIVMFLLAKLNIVSPQKMRQYRKYAVLVIIILSAVITPTADPINLALVAIPLLLLYEIGIMIAYFFARPKPDATASAT
ncbi:MAG: Twin-arginine translocation protein TatC [uncultured Thermomicrobiales bacterium]|uniref:Sec-independent protein translocase protein TatC n=1 Tax=uncultured Thermomicrobiales bacterium TaxID=1645740 RepID=A0A6J4V573_9BACT|nr:MAG: Twin-arginine translocation protein TatC [uncultured Thermomicrobiales bacterium]